MPRPLWETALNWSLRRRGWFRWEWEIDTGRPNRIIARGQARTKFGAHLGCVRALRRILWVG